MNEEKQTLGTNVSGGQTRSHPMEVMRNQILSAQKHAQRCMENVVARARAMVESRSPAFNGTAPQTARLADQNQKEVEKAFQKAQEVVARTFEQFSNLVPPADSGGGQQG